MALSSMPALVGQPLSPGNRAIGPYRVLIADDSSAIRMLIQLALKADPAIEVVAAVAGAKDAIAQTRHRAREGRPVEVLLLDIEMPEMDGLAALPELVAVSPAPKVIMVSSLTHRGADATMRALTLGASDYVCKPVAREGPVARDGTVQAEFGQELARRVVAWGAKARQERRPPGERVVPRPEWPIAPEPSGSQRPELATAPTAIRPAAKMDLDRLCFARPPAAIAIGGSTGAPQVLLRLLADLADCRLGPLFITQHMPPGFTKVLAEQLARAGRRACLEAVDGMPVKANEAYVAKGDHHLVVADEGRGLVLQVNKNPPENYCRPAVDPMFRSLAAVYRDRLLAVVLTGMGQDGMKGAEAIVGAGGRVIAQDQASSVVWGMPGAVVKAGFAVCELPADEIGPALRRIAGGGR